MTKKFKYPLAITGTSEQIREIREDLLRLGHQEARLPNKIKEHTCILLTQFSNEGLDYFRSGLPYRDHMEVSANNKDLVLALAAMVDDDNYHEGEILKHGDGKLYRLRLPNRSCDCVDLDWIWNRDETVGYSYTAQEMWSIGSWRKATKEEIIEHFTKRVANTLVATPNTTEQSNNSTMTYSVDASFIKEAHAAACANWKKKIEEKFPDLFESYRVGQRFKLSNGIEYILARTGDDTVNFINLSDGNRWDNGTRVRNTEKITRDEFASVYSFDEFKLIR